MVSIAFGSWTFASVSGHVPCSMLAINMVERAFWLYYIWYKYTPTEQCKLLKCKVCFWRDSPQWARASSFTGFLNRMRRTTVGRTSLDG